MAASSDGGNQKMARPKEKKSAANVIASSSDEEDKNMNSLDCTPHDVGASGRRQSQRKRGQRFRMPSREEQWNAIHTTPVSHCLSHLKPRKLVNDFTRVTHRYNSDYVEVSGEESMEEFIKDTDSSESTDSNDSSSEAESKSKTRGQHRVRGYRPRIATLADSSEDEKEEEDTCQPSVRQQNPVKENTDNKDDNAKSKPNNLTEELLLQGTAKGSAALQRKESHALTVARKSRKKSVLDSDSDVNSETDSPEDSAVVSAGKRKKRQIMLCSDSENKDSDASGKEGSEEEIRMPQKRTKSAIESDSADNSDAENKLLSDEKENRSKDEEQRTATTSSKAEPGAAEQKQGSKLSNIPSTRTQETQCSDTGYSESTTSDEGSDSEDSDGTESNTESSEHEGRIQKLAAEKERKGKVYSAS